MNSQQQIEQIKARGNQMLESSNIENLVHAMAAFASATADQTSIPSSYEATLAPLLAANWK